MDESISSSADIAINDKDRTKIRFLLRALIIFGVIEFIIIGLTILQRSVDYSFFGKLYILFIVSAINIIGGKVILIGIIVFGFLVLRKKYYIANPKIFIYSVIILLIEALIVFLPHIIFL